MDTQWAPRRAWRNQATLAGRRAVFHGRIDDTASRSARGQAGVAGVVEYAVMIAVVIAALLAMNIYIKRGVVGRLRGVVDSVGEQYDPRHATSNWTMTSNSDVTSTSMMQKNVIIDGHKVDTMISQTQMNAPETSGRSGNENMELLGNNLWN